MASGAVSRRAVAWTTSRSYDVEQAKVSRSLPLASGLDSCGAHGVAAARAGTRRASGREERTVSEPSRSFPRRLVGALCLDASVYEEAEHDPAALGQSALVVGLGGVAEGLALRELLGAAGVIAGLGVGFLAWGAATALVWALGVRLLKHTSDFNELARTLGFASAPRILFVLALLPLGPLYGLLRLVITGLIGVAFVLAVRQALDVGTARAIAVCALSVAVSMLFGFILASPGALGR